MPKKKKVQALGRPVDRSPEVRAAGRPLVGSAARAADCFSSEGGDSADGGRPATPPRVRAMRAPLEPGLKVTPVRVGLARGGTVSGVELPVPEGTTFGKACVTDPKGTPVAIIPTPRSRLVEEDLEMLEREIYTHKEVGVPAKPRVPRLPEHIERDKERITFGAPPRPREDTTNLLAHVDDGQAAEQVGKQVRRAYVWGGLDPAQHRFGLARPRGDEGVRHTLAGEGLAGAAAERVAHYTPAAPKPFSLTNDAHGRSSERSCESTVDIMRSWAPDQQRADVDIGRARGLQVVHGGARPDGTAFGLSNAGRTRPVRSPQ